MAGRYGEEKGRHRAVRLSDLLGQDQDADTEPEDAPLDRRLPSRRARAKEVGEAVFSPASDESGESGESGEPEESGVPAKTKARARPTADDAAMRILAVGDNSVRMLREKLTRRGYSPGEIAGTLDALIAKRYLDDGRLMTRYAESLAAKKFYGAYRIRMEMLRRFDREAVDAHLADALSGIDFAANAAVFVQRNASRGREALIRRMQARGYSAAEIRRALETLSEGG